MSTWWRLNRYLRNGKRIESVEVTKITACFVTVREKSWNGEYGLRSYKKEQEYFPTFNEAKEWEVEQRRIQVENALRNVDIAKEELRKALALAMPVEEKDAKPKA